MAIRISIAIALVTRSVVYSYSFERRAPGPSILGGARVVVPLQQATRDLVAEETEEEHTGRSRNAHPDAADDSEATESDTRVAANGPERVSRWTERRAV